MADALTPIPLFSFPLFVSTLGGHEEHKQPLMSAILDLRSKHPGVRRSNRNAWHSPDRFGADNPHVQWLLGSMSAFAHRALAPFHDNWSHGVLKLPQYWANVMGPGGWNAPHHHFPYNWSAVYYVSAATGTGPQNDELDGMIEFLNPTPWHAMWGRRGNFAQRPQDGLALIFPASLVHFVHPHAHEELRVSVAFNFQVVPKTSS